MTRAPRASARPRRATTTTTTRATTTTTTGGGIFRPKRRDGDAGRADARSTATRNAAVVVARRRAMTRTTATATATEPDARPKRRVAIFVEPSPFSHVSGMKNRFLRLIENLREMGDDVVVITPDRDPPKEYHGAKVIGLRGFVLPFYGTDTLLCSFGLDGRVWREFKENKPDLVHCAVPGGMIFGAMTYCKAMDIPLVESYHTHIPHYIPRYTWAGLVKPMWDLIRFWNGYASTTLVTSSILENELRGEGCKNLQVWDKGVDTVAFNPSFKSEEMRKRLSGGRDGPIIGCVGRLGAEKRLGDLKDILAKLPSNVNLAIIGDGPERKRLEEHFAGTNTVFTGMITGDDLSAAYASLDVFVMPSPSETLGFVVMESMASGVPVVAVAAGGLLDILTNPGDVGLLYPEYDYDKAAEHVKMLLENDSERQRMGAASRADVEKWGWMSSNRNLRENQYSKGLERFFKLRNLRKAIKAIGIRRRAVAVFDFLISGQHILQVAIFAAAVSALVYARQAGPIATATKVKAAFGATSWLNVAESAISKAGPVLAPLCLTAITTLAAIIPFVPTQPLFIMAGLFFGPAYGAALGLCAAVCAAAISASASRARGYRQISDDLAQQTGIGAPARRSIAAQLKKVNRAVSGDGDALVQASKVSLMRLLPHAPFTVTNYLLGLTQVPIRAIVAGTAFGMAPWVVFYAIVGADSRALLASGASLANVVSAVVDAGAAHIPSLLTSTELGLVALCATLLLLRPAAPASPLVC
jgi:sulfoquinovosyltransferase